MNTKIFADGADADEIVRLKENPVVKGFTTNPTLMRAAGVKHYTSFARNILEEIGDQYPISFEVLADTAKEISEQAKKIAAWGPNVFVKVPVSNSTGEPMADVIRNLSEDGVKINVTAILTIDQVEGVTAALSNGSESFISVLAGRVADTGIDPVPVMQNCLKVMESAPSSELIWASPREVLNVVQANDIGCHIITVTGALLSKLDMLGLDLHELSLDTVRMFKADAERAGYTV